jgi:hypothetical protein
MADVAPTRKHSAPPPVACQGGIAGLPIFGGPRRMLIFDGTTRRRHEPWKIPKAVMKRIEVLHFVWYLASFLFQVEYLGILRREK